MSRVSSQRACRSSSSIARQRRLLPIGNTDFANRVSREPGFSRLGPLVPFLQRAQLLARQEGLHGAAPVSDRRRPPAPARPRAELIRLPARQPPRIDRSTVLGFQPTHGVGSTTRLAYGQCRRANCGNCHVLHHTGQLRLAPQAMSPGSRLPRPRGRPQQGGTQSHRPRADGDQRPHSRRSGRVVFRSVISWNPFVGHARSLVTRRRHKHICAQAEILRSRAKNTGLVLWQQGPDGASLSPYFLAANGLYRLQH